MATHHPPTTNRQTADAVPTPFARQLLAWFADHGRQLPWRATRDPYAIWLSEVILQQTRIQQGTAYWQRFMERWPTVDRLAAATEDEVLRQWQGLGYYSRARNLHAAARQVASMGAFPRTADGLRRLKGVGDYTAAAIASFAFDEPEAVVDGNVYRVLSRHFGIDTPINTTAGKHLFAEQAQRQLPPARAADYNQAIMDFGATWCTPQTPRCDDCPLRTSCVAYATGTVATLPVKLRTVEVRDRRLAYIYIRWEGQTAIRRRGQGDIWQGLWEPLLVEDADFLRDTDEADSDTTPPTLTMATLAPQAATRWVETHLALTTDDCTLWLLRRRVRHVLTHRRLLCDFYLLHTRRQPQLPDGYVWVPSNELDRYALPRLVELLLQALPQPVGT